jgi:hemoglobin
MKKDIENRADIDLLMRAFYARAMRDAVIGYIFTDVAKLDLDHHLPIIGDFWESMLFGTRVYQKHGRNPLMVHKDLHEKSPLRPEHFDRWLKLFETAIDNDFEGERANLLKARARMIGSRFRAALEIPEDPYFKPADIGGGNRPHQE